MAGGKGRARSERAWPLLSDHGPQDRHERRQEQRRDHARERAAEEGLP